MAEQLSIAIRRITELKYDVPKLSHIVVGSMKGKWVYYDDKGDPLYIGSLEECLNELKRDYQVG